MRSLQIKIVARAIQVGGVREIAVVQEQLDVAVVRVLIQMIDTIGIE